MNEYNEEMSIESLRIYKIWSYAIFDMAVSFLGIYLLAPWLSLLMRKLGLNVPKQNWLYLTLPLSILIHWAFGTMTPMTRNFFDLQSNYLLKILILGLLILGLRGIKRL